MLQQLNHTLHHHINLLKKWDSPILIFVGLKDYRIPYAESLQAFTAARTMGLDSRLVAFSDEGHHILKPQNSMVWQREFFGWLDKYLKNNIVILLFKGYFLAN